MPSGIPRQTRTRVRRRLHLAGLRLKRAASRVIRSVYLVNAAVWTAAGALVGFEVLDALVGGMVVAPEAVPLLLVALALWWWVRNRRGER
ncbi:MAG TPA: hypothetical protein VJR25_14170 [Microbacterium sp.]|uniref:hypothetical protein n=1 Tax=Microbacterium sp. TaxID=51671 RepID=UPI002B462B33|nr:hypothetical protein [Microbacterium sp.]HKT57906.1 hypothetical protein [Microbacterium sp.]